MHDILREKVVPPRLCVRHTIIRTNIGAHRSSTNVAIVMEGSEFVMTLTKWHSHSHVICSEFFQFEVALRNRSLARSFAAWRCLQTFFIFVYVLLIPICRQFLIDMHTLCKRLRVCCCTLYVLSVSVHTYISLGISLTKNRFMHQQLSLAAADTAAGSTSSKAHFILIFVQ